MICGALALIGIVYSRPLATLAGIVPPLVCFLGGELFVEAAEPTHVVKVSRHHCPYLTRIALVFVTTTQSSAKADALARDMARHN